MDFNSLTVVQLREKLSEFGLSKVGNKADLVARLEEQRAQMGMGIAATGSSSQTSTNSEDLIMNMKSINLAVNSSNPWEKMTVPQLKEEVAKYGIKVTGSRLKADYLIALQSYFKTDLNDRPDFHHVRHRNLRVLMIAEKPSMGREIAKVLANRRYIREYKTSDGKLSVSEFQGSLFGYSADFRVSSTFGHIFSESFHKDVPRNADEELFDAKIVKVPCDDSHDLPKALAEIADGVDAIVLWLDCDLEGEAICYEVLDCVRDVINRPPSGNVMDVVFRARFSAADEATDAMERLQKPDFRQCLAARAKHDLDLRIGVAMSKYQTYTLRRYLRGLDIPHISYGPCQIPCLTFCVDAQEAVEKHLRSYNYHIVVKLELDGTVVDAKSNLFKDKAEAEECLRRIQRAQQAQVVNVERKSHVKRAPPALNTVALLKLCSTQLGIGPKDAMQVAERLYTSGLISYPRTETTRYPAHLRLRERHRGIRENIPSIGDDVEYMDWEAAEKAPRDGVDAGDHPPIMPTGKSGHLRLNPKETRVYEMICRHFLASLMPSERYHSDTVVFAADGVEVSRTVQGIDDMGFASVISWQRANIDPGKRLDFTPMKGQSVRILNVKMTETPAPSPMLLNEAQLMDLMEKHRIGTDASIPGHVDNIIKRKYVIVHPETRRITPTTLGRTLINVYRKCVPQLAEPQLRAQMEVQLMKIAKGEHDFEEVRVHVLNAFRVQFKLFKESFHNYCPSFEPCFEKDPNFVDFNNRGAGSGPNRNGGFDKRKYDGPSDAGFEKRRNLGPSKPEFDERKRNDLPKYEAFDSRRNDAPKNQGFEKRGNDGASNPNLEKLGSRFRGAQDDAKGFFNPPTLNRDAFKPRFNPPPPQRRRSPTPPTKKIPLPPPVVDVKPQIPSARVQPQPRPAPPPVITIPGRIPKQEVKPIPQKRPPPPPPVAAPPPSAPWHAQTPAAPAAPWHRESAAVPAGRYQLPPPPPPPSVARKRLAKKNPDPVVPCYDIADDDDDSDYNPPNRPKKKR
uniref:DNA topoisomerase n=1 Tax=Panagrellus redivivus TaxID=6233 RepID=A0A7E4W4E9_PANRE